MEITLTEQQRDYLKELLTKFVEDKWNSGTYKSVFMQIINKLEEI